MARGVPRPTQEHPDPKMFYLPYLKGVIDAMKCQYKLQEVPRCWPCWEVGRKQGQGPHLGMVFRGAC